MPGRPASTNSTPAAFTALPARNGSLTARNSARQSLSLTVCKVQPRTRLRNLMCGLSAFSLPKNASVASAGGFDHTARLRISAPMGLADAASKSLPSSVVN